MTFLAAPSEAASKIVQALKLPDSTIAFTFKMRVGELATITVESYVNQNVADEVALVLKDYMLVENEDL